MRVLIVVVLAGCELIAGVPTGTRAIDGPETSCAETCVAPTPVCDVEAKACVECQTNAECSDPARPTCDAHACRACRIDDDCGSKVCLGDGTCAAASRILYTSPTGTSASCADSDPCSLETAMTLLSPTIDIVKLSGTYTRMTSLTPTAKALFAGDGATLVADPAIPMFTYLIAADGTELSIRGLSVELSQIGAGISCTNGTLKLERVRVANGTIGVVASPCDLTMSRSVVLKQGSYGVFVSTGPVNISNSMITDNGAAATSFGGLFLSQVTGGRVEHVTMSANTANSTGAKAVRCQMSGLVQFRSNIIFGNASPAIDNVCNVSYSVIDAGYTGPGTMNRQTPPQFKSATDFHLMTTSPVQSTGDPASTITIDIDGDPRPYPAGMPPDPGADEI